MKALRPATIVTLGPLLLGIAVAVGASVAMPDSRDLSSFASALAIGAAVGLAGFWPIAAILAVGDRRPEWLARHSWRIDFYSSLAMALSIGYLAACMRHSVSDSLVLAAVAVVILGATIKTALSYAARQQRRDSVR